MMTYIKERTYTEQAGILASYLPDNECFGKKSIGNGNLRKVLIGLAGEFLRFRGTINQLVEEYFPDSTTLFIEDWEKVVGIPDECFPVASTLEERRTNVLLKLAGTNATTAKQFEEIADILGFDIEVTNATDFSQFPYQFPIPLLSASEIPFVIIVNIFGLEQGKTFPYEFPITFTEPVEQLLRCLFEKLIPAHCKLFFRFV
jgi:uncharacterized protein YmfQ (DUF2313 family)